MVHSTCKSGQNALLPVRSREATAMSQQEARSRPWWHGWTGDAAAAAELVRRYETNIRVAVRTRLTDPAAARAVRLRRRMPVSAGQLFRPGRPRAIRPEGSSRPDRPVGADVQQVGQPEAVPRSAPRRRPSHRRRCRRPAGTHGGGGRSAAIAAGRELLDAIRAELVGEEVAIADLRGQGCTWPEVACGWAAPRRPAANNSVEPWTA